MAKAVLGRWWMMDGNGKFPVTPDGRYFVVRNRLWRMTDPLLDPKVKMDLIVELMDARRAVGAALKHEDNRGEAEARQRVDAAKHALGERGLVWWNDGAPDYNRRMVKNTPYADWYLSLSVLKR